jgi:hypothetical protein
VIQFRRQVRLGKTSNRLPFPLAIRQAAHSSKPTFARALRVMAPTLVALSLAGVAHAQGTMDFSGAQTLMGTFKTFAVYAGVFLAVANQRSYGERQSQSPVATRSLGSTPNQFR